MTVIRQFLKRIDHPISGIDNKNLGLSRQISYKKLITVSPSILQKISEPIPKILLELQIHFGLTNSEAMRLLPDIHIRDNSLWITREIASNSQV